MKPGRHCENGEEPLKVIDGPRPNLTSKIRRSRSSMKKQTTQVTDEKPHNRGSAVVRSKSTDEECKTQKSGSLLKPEENNMEEKSPE